MPDSTIKGKSPTTIFSNTQSQLNQRASAALNNLLGSSIRIGENNVYEIFDKIENCETETNYGYSQQKGIGQKPVPVFTGEELKAYSLNIKLHFDYCNPDNIIARLEEKAKQQEVFSYFQGDKYIGEYVITKIAKNILSKFENVTLYAEIVVDLLEVPQDENEEFEQQTKSEVEPPADAQTVTQSKFQNAVTVAKNTAGSVFERLTDKVIDEALRNAESYVNSSIGGAIGDGIL